MNIINKIKNLFSLQNIVKEVWNKETRDSFTVLVKNKKIPLALIEKEWKTILDVWFTFYDFKILKDYYLLKLKVTYIDNNKIKIPYIKNTKIINFEYKTIKDDYFWSYNVLSYVANWTFPMFGDEIKNNDEENKTMQYRFYQLLDFIKKYDKNKSNIFDKTTPYMDLTDAIIYENKKHIIDNTILFLEKTKLWKSKKYKDVMAFKDFEKSKKYKIFEVVKKEFDRNENIKPLLTEYLDTNIDQCVFVDNEKEKYHKIFKINNNATKNIFETITNNNRIGLTYKFYKWYYIYNMEYYLYYIEYIFNNVFVNLRKEKEDKIFMGVNEKLSLEDKEEIVVPFQEVLIDNNVTEILSNFYRILNDDSFILWYVEALYSYKIKNPNNITVEEKKDLKELLKYSNYYSFFQEDYITSILEEKNINKMKSDLLGVLTFNTL